MGLRGCLGVEGLGLRGGGVGWNLESSLPFAKIMPVQPVCNSCWHQDVRCSEGPVP